MLVKCLATFQNQLIRRVGGRAKSTETDRNDGKAS
jgi:hypothetical protein